MYKIGENKIGLVKGDITKLDVECIINAANKSLLGGGGVDGAIHRGAGPELLQECRTLHGCETGEAKITKGYNLKAVYIIHTVGPVYSGSEMDKKLLEKCYLNSLELAKQHNIRSIAFPAISTGIYGYPLTKAVPIAWAAITKWLQVHEDYGITVVLVCFDKKAYEMYQTVAEQWDKYTFKMAEPEDAGAILKIYEPYIKETAITFETEVPSLTEFAGRIETIRRDYPYIVCCLNNQIVGYAYAHRQMERAAYQWNAELSVYIHKSCHQRGIGKKLYQALMEILQLQNVKNIYGGVTCPNIKSEKLHENLGFNRLGVYRRSGYKSGAWHDVAWFEKGLGEYETPPEPFRSIKEIAPERIEEILRWWATGAKGL